MNSERPGFFRNCLHGLFGVYTWLVFVAIVLFSIVVAIVVPRQKRRHKLMTGAARSIFVLTGTTPDVRGIEYLPAGHCVVVANHASYVDGLLLKAYLPWRFSFVIKGEMRNIPIVHFMLRRSGSKFVERFQAAGSARDARAIVKAAQGGESLAFFPEGTFIKQAGVSRFRSGAFAAAIKGAMPVVPIAIIGTRSMMPSDGMLPRPCPISIEILPPIEPDDPAFDNSRALAETARQQILSILDEPDLVEPDFIKQ